MNLNSLSFLGIFLPLLLVAYYNPFFKTNRFRKIVLLLASIGLYAFCEPIYVLLLLFIIVLNYALVSICERTACGVWRAVAIVLDVAVLLFFKYYHMVLGIFVSPDSFGRIAFPIGLSYFIFKSISYVVDSKNHPGGTLVDSAIYISNFLTIVSGPLSTYEAELPCIREKQKTTASAAYDGAQRFVLGLAKKILIADSLGTLVSQCFAATELSILGAWLGAIAYTLQLYFDFSGYTDMAIGIGRFFGFCLPENFNYPYMAVSVSDFWKRWHISLTKWFTKYVYIPLGGSRVKTAARHIFNLLVVWLVTGIWHGSDVTFLIWAMGYFLLQLLEKYTHFENTLKKLHIGHIYTLLVVVLLWVVFRAESVSSAAFYLRCMFSGTLYRASDLTALSAHAVPLVLGVVFSTNIGGKIHALFHKNAALSTVYSLVLLALFCLCIVISISQGYSAPLYAGF